MNSPSPQSGMAEAPGVQGTREFAVFDKVRFRQGLCLYGVLLVRLRKCGWLVAWQDGIQVTAQEEQLELVDEWPAPIRARMEAIETEARRRVAATVQSLDGHQEPEAGAQGVQS